VTERRCPCVRRRDQDSPADGEARAVTTKVGVVLILILGGTRPYGLRRGRGRLVVGVI
jgi:hypothetical protein